LEDTSEYHSYVQAETVSLLRERFRQIFSLHREIVVPGFEDTELPEILAECMAEARKGWNAQPQPGEHIYQDETINLPLSSPGFVYDASATLQLPVPFFSSPSTADERSSPVGAITPSDEEPSLRLPDPGLLETPVSQGLVKVTASMNLE